MKITAWPAVPVLASMIAARDGARAARTLVGAAAAVAASLIAAAAPTSLADPSALFQNVVLFPLGLTRHKTPAASPLPGHQLAVIGSAAHLASVGLLLAAGLALGVSVLIRPPADVPAATWRLALGLVLIFLLAPAARFGYFAYPLGLLGWTRLTRPDALAGGGRQSAAADGRGVVPPVRGSARQSQSVGD